MRILLCGGLSSAEQIGRRLAMQHGPQRPLSAAFGITHYASGGSIMRKSRIEVAFGVAVPFTALLAMTGPTMAAESYDLTNCGSSTVTVISASEGLTVLNIDAKGIARSNPEKKAFDNSTFHCGLSMRIAGADWGGIGYCKFMDPDGDFIVGEQTPAGPTGGAWKFLFGTGKWKGITGGGKYAPLTSGKAIVPGTGQSCSRATGTYELKK